MTLVLILGMLAAAFACGVAVENARKSPHRWPLPPLGNIAVVLLYRWAHLWVSIARSVDQAVIRYRHEREAMPEPDCLFNAGGTL